MDGKDPLEFTDWTFKTSELQHGENLRTLESEDVLRQKERSVQVPRFNNLERKTAETAR